MAKTDPAPTYPRAEIAKLTGPVEVPDDGELGKAVDAYYGSEKYRESQPNHSQDLLLGASSLRDASHQHN